MNSPAQPRAALTDILENYAQVLEERNEKIGRKMRTQILPRYSKLSVVRRLDRTERSRQPIRQMRNGHNLRNSLTNSATKPFRQIILYQ